MTIESERVIQKDMRCDRCNAVIPAGTEIHGFVKYDSMTFGVGGGTNAGWAPNGRGIVSRTEKIGVTCPVCDEDQGL